MSRVVILDRDGTMVIDRGYLADPEGLEFEPGAAEALRLLHSSGHRLVVATNQSGVGRGYFTLERLLAMNARLHAMVRAAGAALEAIYYCPHAPEEACDCRKPAQGLMRRAAAELHFDPDTAVVIGDRDSDVEFGRRAGAMTILLDAGVRNAAEALGRGSLAGASSPCSGEPPTRESPTRKSPTGESPTGESPTGESPTGESRADRVVPNLLAAALWLTRA
jgi:D-glycero-D-manno-heptose 1,7-bisphosphate phosphatase